MQHAQRACESTPEATQATLLPLLQSPLQCCGCATARHQKPHWQRCPDQRARHVYAAASLSYRWTYHLLPVHVTSPHPAVITGFCKQGVQGEWRVASVMQGDCTCSAWKLCAGCMHLHATCAEAASRLTDRASHAWPVSVLQTRAHTFSAKQRLTAA